jgi:hypothetical protein
MAVASNAFRCVLNRTEIRLPVCYGCMRVDVDGPDGPLYAQISRSGVTLHLSEHNAPGTVLLVRMNGLDTLPRELSTTQHGYALRLVHTPDDRRELQVSDAFGNWLRFSENNASGVSSPAAVSSF